MIRFKETAAIFLFLATVHAHPGGYAFHSAATGLGSASAYSGAVVSSEPYGPSGLGQFGARYSSNIGVRDNEAYPGAAAGGDLGKAQSLRPNQSHRGKSQNGCSKCDDGQYKGDEYYEENEEEEDYEDEGDECDDGDDGQYHEHYNKGRRPGSHRHPAQAHSPDKAGAEVDKSGGPLGVQKIYGGGAGKFDAQQPSPQPSWQQPEGNGNLGNNVGQPGIPQSQASTPTWQQQNLPGSWGQSPGDNAHGPSNCGSLQCGEPHRSASGASSGPSYPGSPPSTYSSYGSGANGGKFIPSPGNPFLPQGVQKQSPIADGSTYGDGNAFGPAKPPGPHSDYKPSTQSTQPPIASFPGPAQQPNQYGGYYPQSQTTQKPFGSVSGPSQHPNQYDGYSSQPQLTQKPFGSASGPSQRPNQYDGYNPPSQITQKPFGSTFGPAQRPNQFDGYNPQSQTAQKPFGSASDPAQHPNQYGGYNPQSQTTQKPFGSASGPSQHPNQFNGYNPQSQITQKPFVSTSGPAQHPNQYDGYNPQSQITQRPFGSASGPAQHPNQFNGYNPQSQATQKPFGSASGPAQHPNQFDGYSPQSQITQKPFGSASGTAQHPNQYGGYNPPSQTTQTTQRPFERTGPSTQPGYYGGYSTVSQSTPSPFGGTTPIPTPKRPNFPARPPWTSTQSTPSWNQNKPNTYNYSNPGSPNIGAPSGCSGAPGSGSGSNCNSLSKDLEPPKKTPYGQSEPNPYSPGKEGPGAQCSAGNKSACSSESKKGDDSPLFYIQVQPAIPGHPGSGRKPPIGSGNRPTNSAGAENNRPYGSSTPSYGNSNTFPNAAFPLTGSTPSWSPSAQAPDNKPGDYGYTRGSPYDQRNTDKAEPWKVTGNTEKSDDSGPTGSTPSWPARSGCSSNNCNNYGPGGHPGTTPSPWPAPKEHRAPCTSGNCQNSPPVGKNDYPPNAGSTPFWPQGRGGSSSSSCTSSNCQSYAPGGPPVTIPSPWSQSSAGPAHKPENYSPGGVPGAYPSGNRPQSGAVSPGSYSDAGASSYGGSPSHQLPLSSGPGAGTFPSSHHPLAGGNNGAPETNHGPGSECKSASVPGSSPCSAREQPQGSSAGSSGSCGGSASGGCGGGGGGGGAAAGPTKISGSAGGVGAGDIGKNNPFFFGNPPARGKENDDRALAVTPLGGPTERPIGKGNPFLDKSYVVPEGGYAAGGAGAHGGQPADNHGPKTSRPIGQGNPFLEGLQPNRGHPNYNGDQGPKGDDERHRLQVTPLGGYGPTVPPTIPRQPWSSDSGFPKPAHPEADYSQGPAAPAHSGAGTPCGPVKCTGNQLDDGSYGATSPENGHNGSNGEGSKNYNPYSGFEQGTNQASKQTGGANWTFGHTGSSASASAYAYSGSSAGSWSGK